MATWTIVSVDDDPATLNVLKNRLSFDTEIRVLTAGNGKDGLALIEKEKPDVIILDHLPPENAGIALCKTIKSNPALQETPVIFFTSFREFGFEASAEAAGAFRFIAKLDLAKLIETLQSLRTPDAAADSGDSPGKEKKSVSETKLESVETAASKDEPKPAQEQSPSFSTLPFCGGSDSVCDAV